MTADYVAHLTKPDLLLDGDAALQQRLSEIDAAVLASYALPVRLERELLQFFENVRRPVAHSWAGWPALDNAPGLSLAEILDGSRDRFSGNWVRSVFGPLPEAEIEALRPYLR
ncbi:MAG: hypothetical protein EOP18_03395 [Rhizobiaceae bacterium]|nr:MAG: hypothetical protein EOP18_03395 [Rhizobiaceae bacterium]